MMKIADPDFTGNIGEGEARLQQTASLPPGQGQTSNNAASRAVN